MNHALRLRHGQDLLGQIQIFLREKNIQAAVLQTCVGSLETAKLRLAGAAESVQFVGPFEIISLVGTLSINGCHLHIGLADAKGQCLGGHLLSGCVIHTTAEIVIQELKDFKFHRQQDPETGYRELVIK